MVEGADERVSVVIEAETQTQATGATIIDDSRLAQVSKTTSYALRHGALMDGELHVFRGGWVREAELAHFLWRRHNEPRWRWPGKPGAAARAHAAAVEEVRVVVSTSTSSKDWTQRRFERAAFNDVACVRARYAHSFPHESADLPSTAFVVPFRCDQCRVGVTSRSHGIDTKEEGGASGQETPRPVGAAVSGTPASFQAEASSTVEQAKAAKIVSRDECVFRRLPAGSADRELDATAPRGAEGTPVVLPSRAEVQWQQSSGAWGREKPYAMPWELFFQHGSSHQTGWRATWVSPPSLFQLCIHYVAQHLHKLDLTNFADGHAMDCVIRRLGETGKLNSKALRACALPCVEHLCLGEASSDADAEASPASSGVQTSTSAAGPDADAVNGPARPTASNRRPAAGQGLQHKHSKRHQQQQKVQPKQPATYISDSSLKLIGKQCPNLQQLSLRNCDYVVTDELLIFMLRRAPHVRQLDVSGCKQLTDASLGAIAKFGGQLEEVRLARLPLVSGTMLSKALSTLAADHAGTSAGASTMIAGGPASPCQSTRRNSHTSDRYRCSPLWYVDIRGCTNMTEDVVSAMLAALALQRVEGGEDRHGLPRKKLQVVHDWSPRR